MRAAWLAILVLAFSGSAHAEVAQASPGAFLIQGEAVVSQPPERAWRALGQAGRWWNMEHSYSRDGDRLSLDLRAGGCLCERWDGQSVEHAHVVMATNLEGVRTLRMIGALGPLQELGLSGVLTFTIRPDPAGSKIAVSYRVSGDPGLALDGPAPFVDQVIMEQFARFIRYTETGSPD